MRCDVKINGELIKAIIDTGASVSVITNKLRKELEIPITRKSKEVLVAANGEKVVVIGETEMEIEIEEWIIPIEVRIVESKDKTLLIGINTLENLEASINIKNRILKIEIEDEEIEIPIEYKRNKASNFEKEVYEEVSEEEEGYDAFEEPEYKEFMTMSENKDNDLGEEMVFAGTAERH
jgi:predicted aspartyl protease